MRCTDPGFSAVAHGWRARRRRFPPPLRPLASRRSHHAPAELTARPVATSSTPRSSVGPGPAAGSPSERIEGCWLPASPFTHRFLDEYLASETAGLGLQPAQEIGPSEMIAEIARAGLRGRGGGVPYRAEVGERRRAARQRASPRLQRERTRDLQRPGPDAGQPGSARGGQEMQAPASADPQTGRPAGRQAPALDVRQMILRATIISSVC
jgi:hypothetical protein